MKAAGFVGVNDLHMRVRLLIEKSCPKVALPLEISAAFLLLKWEKQFGTVKSLA